MLEAVRFFAIATAILLGITALVDGVAGANGIVAGPRNSLAKRSESVPDDWHFEAPESAKNTIELPPLAAALEVAMARLQRSFEQQKRFTSDAAHELKTDVAIVKSSSAIACPCASEPSKNTVGAWRSAWMTSLAWSQPCRKCSPWHD